MTQALALPDDAGVLDAVADPGAYVLASLERARSWLTQATTTDLPDLVEAKARAEAIRCYVAQKELGKDTELAATEIVRRAERRIGQLIREGQATGEIKKPERHGDHDAMSMSPRDVLSVQEANQVYAMTDGVTDEEFEDVIAEAKTEKNLSRANVVRKTRQKKSGEAALQNLNREVRVQQITELASTGMTSKQIGVKIGLSDEYVRKYAREANVIIVADNVVGSNRHRLNHDRMLSELVHAVDGAATVAGMVDVSQVDPSQIAGWVDSLSASLSKLSTLKRDLAKESTQP